MELGTIFSRFKNKLSSEGKPEKTIPFWVLWDEYLAMVQSKDNSLEGISKSSNFYADLTKMYSGKNNIAVMYVIDNYNETMHISYKSRIRLKTLGDTKVTFIDRIVPHNINFKDEALKGRVRAVGRQQQEIAVADDFMDLDETFGTQKRTTTFSESYKYFYAAQEAGRALMVVKPMFIVHGTRGRDFDETLNGIQEHCITNGINIRRVQGNLDETMNYFSPFSLKDIQLPADKTQLKVANPIVLTDEIYARQFTYSHGTASYGSMTWGTDIYSYKPIQKDPKRSSDSAENWLIAAETGGGKSHLVKYIILQLLANNLYIGTINDLEGDEYLPIAYLIASQNPEQVKILNMGEGTGAYFDPVPIYLSGDEEQDKEMLQFSQSFTLSLFKTLVTEQRLVKYDWMENMLKRGIDNFYNQIGIKTNDPSTWEITQNYSVRDVYKCIKDLEVPNELARNEYDLMISQLDANFDGGEGSLSMFENQITFDEIKNSKLILCSFGMAGKSVDQVDKTSMALMQLYTANISHLRSIFAKAQGKFNFKVWEELPRWADFPDAEKTLKTPLVGGRKLGDINIIITNKPSELLTTDRFGIFDSVTSFALGAIGDTDVRTELCRKLNIPHMQNELDTIEGNRVASQSKGKAKEGYADIMNNMYSKAFLVGLDKVDFYVSKVMIPREIAISDIFKTGVDIRKAEREAEN